MALQGAQVSNNTFVNLSRDAWQLPICVGGHLQLALSCASPAQCWGLAEPSMPAHQLTVPHAPHVADSAPCFMLQSARKQCKRGGAAWCMPSLTGMQKLHTARHPINSLMSAPH